ncbi:DUF6702 family protein [Acidiluteibacter ferrifornacis]|uniref:Uncharacterized protein n=1 Tax=Acidiluteibacter ferrifornacis TaxID=2692424 RepID=A0A6N9NL19_9FLAO|nr:DUF6702 family protein [Acidiluteibacter ferrifornacis]NBG65930.1 hypothetical protein [Acidiluteibacter ferrifornacis]
MKKWGLILLLLVSAQVVSAHKFYVSLTQINYNSKTKSIEVTLKLFTDDLELSTTNFSKKTVKIINAEDSDVEIANYIKDKFSISINNKVQVLNYLGKEMENDVSWCYLEIKNVTDIQSIKINNRIFTEQFPDQKNLIHLNVNGVEESAVLTKNTTTFLIEL